MVLGDILRKTNCKVILNISGVFLFWTVIIIMIINIHVEKYLSLTVL